MATPGLAGPLVANPHPFAIDLGSTGKIYVTGAVTGLGLWQDHAFPGDRETRADLSNAQVFVQNSEGPVQFFVQAGAYTLPSLGAAYVPVGHAADLTYGYVPVAFVKLIPSAHFNIMAGLLPSLQGAESTFSFQNMNINRGLLWNQENAINRGVQINVTSGPLTASVSLNDGFFSGKYNWLSGLLSYAVTPRDTIALVGAGNLGSTAKSSFATPFLLNNGQLYNAIWTHGSGPWTIQPYLQYERVPANARLGIPVGASTWGAALLARYTFSSAWSVAGRAEYEKSSGSAARGTPNLLYGPGSRAWSLTLTPTFQRRIFFARAEFAYVRADGIMPGAALGPTFSSRTQSRAAIEAGILF